MSTIVKVSLNLDPENENLLKLNSDLKNKITSKKVQTLLTGIVAAYDYSESKEAITSQDDPSYFPERLAGLALTGNKTAQNIFTKLLLFSEITKFRKREEASLNATEKVKQLELNDRKLKAFDPKDLISVRVMKYKPELLGEDWIISSPFDGSKGEIARTSVHFTLNHKVSSHMFGNWDDAKYTILTPFNTMVDNNDQPENLNTVDTWWNLYPGQNLKIPKLKSVLIEQKNDLDELMKVQENGAHILVKVKNFTEDDITQIKDMLKSDPERLDKFKQELKEDSNDFDRVCRSTLVDYIVSSQIESLGFEVQGGGMWSWNGNDMNATYQSMLYAAKYATEFGAHSHKPDSNYNRRLNPGEKITIDQDANISTQLLQALYLNESIA